MSKVPENKPDNKTETKDGADKAADRTSDAKVSAAKPADKPDLKSGAKVAPGSGAKPSAKPAPGRKPSGVIGRIGVMGWIGIVAVVLLGVVIVGGVTLKSWWPVAEPYIGAWVQPLLPGPTDAEKEDAARIASIEKRLSAVEQSSGEAAPADALADLEAERAQLSQQISGIMTRLDKAENALDGLKRQAAVLTTDANGESGAATAAADLNARLGKIEALGNDLEKSRTDSEQALKSLNDKIDAVAAARKNVSDAGFKAQALLLAVADVRRPALAGQPFDAPLADVSASAPDDPMIAAAVGALQPHAAEGVATLDELRRQFKAAAGPIVQAGRALADTGWLNAAINKVTSLVSVRRVDGAGDPASPDAVVADAEKRLSAGDLTGAVDLIGSLKGKAAEAAAGWLDAAKARLAVVKALDELHDHAVHRLRAEAGNAPVGGEN